MTRTIVLVGATSGIGRAAATQLAARGHRLLLIGRDARRGRALTTRLATGGSGGGGDAGARPVFIAGDVSTRAGIEAIVTEIRDHTDTVDALLNNAGVMLPARRLTGEGMELNFAIHHLAPYTMTGLLLPLLRRGEGRIVNTNSEGHRMNGETELAQLQSEDRYGTLSAYARTKLANLLFTYEFSRRFPEFTIVAVHPGMVRSRLVRSPRNPGIWLASMAAQPFLMPAGKGAGPLVHLATSPDVESGRYYNRFTPTASSPRSMSRAAARRLWELTERLRGPLVDSATP
jgi:NAD(P)-dependent dehydrogenase (short-subunit alcohol dehydrogenase family)